MTIPLNSSKDHLIWTFDFALSTFFEVETEIIEPLLPIRLAPVEVVPGVSLISITSFNFKEGSLGTLPEFQELIFSAIVSPDLTRGVPKFAMYVISLTSNCQKHLDHSIDYYKLPVTDLLSNVEINSDKLAVTYKDSQGTILTMNNCSQITSYKHEELYFQAFTSMDDTIFVADLYIQGYIYEHQQAGNAGALYDHSFFNNLEIEENELPPFLQMMNEPGKIGKQFYFRPEVFI